MKGRGTQTEAARADSGGRKSWSTNYRRGWSACQSLTAGCSHASTWLRCTGLDDHVDDLKKKSAPKNRCPRGEGRGEGAESNESRAPTGASPENRYSVDTALCPELGTG